MSNNRSSGGYFSKDADKLIYSSDKSGIFNIYEVDLSTNEETQLTELKRGVILCKRLHTKVLVRLYIQQIKVVMKILIFI
jgi:hypothetical protein